MGGVPRIGSVLAVGALYTLLLLVLWLSCGGWHRAAPVKPFSTGAEISKPRAWRCVHCGTENDATTLRCRVCMRKQGGLS